MKRRLRQLVLLLIALCPLQKIKRLLYGSLFRYDIAHDAYIGFSYIDVDNLILETNARIGHLNHISGIHTFTIKKGGEIKWLNTIVVSRGLNVETSFILGEQATLTREHFFDLSGSITIGKNTVIGGIQSQFWTHSFNIKRQMRIDSICIGDHCFIGSAVRFSPGSEIPDRCVVGIASVVTKRFQSEGVLIAGVPARVVRTLESI